MYEVIAIKQCSVDGCSNKHHAKGYCNKHYRQYKKNGEVSRTKYDPNEIILYDDYAEIVIYNKDCEEVARALIDIDDIDKVIDYKWVLSHGYAFNVKNNIRLHRLVMDYSDNKVVDHINRNPLDNRKENLRVCTQQQNSMNRTTQSNNTSGTVGVYWAKSRNRWCAQIMLNKKNIFLGYYEDMNDAIQARKQAEIDYFGEYRSND